MATPSLPATPQPSKPAATDDDYEKRRLDLFSAGLDRESDRLVYQIYELTEDEIAIVEGSTADH